MDREPIVVAFSGGRTSGYMSYWIKRYLSHLYEPIFVYANTGLEHEKTLEFIDKVDKHLELNLIWVEAKVYHNERKACGYNLVSYETASRNGEPFEEVIKKYGLPNQNFLHCTRELKNNPIKAWKQDNGYKDSRIALGIRYDEFRRVKARPDAIYPLATISKTTKEDILKYWSKQPFDLEIEEHYGNCVSCYKKSDKKLKMIADENPNYFDFFIDMENKYETIKPKDGEDKRIIFRNYRTAYEVKNNLKLPDNIMDIDECAEECGSVIMEDKE